MDDIVALIVNISTSVVVCLFLLFLCSAFLFPDFTFKRFFGCCDYDDYQKLLLKNDEKFKQVIDCYILIESSFTKNLFPRFIYADKSMPRISHLRSLWNDIEELIYHIKKIKCDWRDRAGLNYMIEKLKEFEKIVDKENLKEYGRMVINNPPGIEKRGPCSLCYRTASLFSNDICKECSAKIMRKINYTNDNQ